MFVDSCFKAKEDTQKQGPGVVLYTDSGTRYMRKVRYNGDCLFDIINRLLSTLLPSIFNPITILPHYPIQNEHELVKVLCKVISFESLHRRE